MTVRDVLVLRALGLGDFLTAVPAYRGLRRAFPSARLTLAAPEVLTPLLGPVGAIDRLIPTAGLGRLAYAGRPDIAVNLHGSGPQSIDDLLRTRPGRLLSHAHRHRPEVTGPAWLEDQHDVVRWCRLLESVTITADPTDLQLSKPGCRAPFHDAVVIHPGAAGRARRWPPRRFAILARRLTEDGHQVVLTAGPRERRATSHVLHTAGLPRSRLLADLDLSGLAALVARARLVICGDTGVAHLASAYGTPSVIMFGPTPPKHWGPPVSGPHTVLWSGRSGDPHGRRTDPGLLAITTEDVLRAARLRLEDPEPTAVRKDDHDHTSRRTATSAAGA